MLTRHLNANSHKARPHRGTEELRHGKSVPQKTSQKTVACQQAPGMWLHRAEKKRKSKLACGKTCPKFIDENKVKWRERAKPNQARLRLQHILGAPISAPCGSFMCLRAVISRSRGSPSNIKYATRCSVVAGRRQSESNSNNKRKLWQQQQHKKTRSQL